MKREALIELHKQMNDYGLELMSKKNADYTNKGVDSLANFKAIQAYTHDPQDILIGMLARLSDKISRLATFIKHGSYEVKGESVYDTVVDARNYLVLIQAALNEVMAAVLDKEQAKVLVDKMRAPDMGIDC